MKHQNTAFRIWRHALLVLMGLSSSLSIAQSSLPEWPVFKTQQQQQLSTILQQSTPGQVVYVGETHNRYADHLLQGAVLASFVDQGKPVALGVEWFQRPFQSVVNRYIAGEISEAELLRGTEYFKRWGFDYRHYRALMRYAREHKVPVVAMNAAKEVTDAVMMQGIDNVPASIKSQLPQSYDFDIGDYRKALEKIFGQHDHAEESDSDGVDRFMQVQLTWDETMAESVARYINQNPSSHLVVLAGRGHVHKAGIPSRVTRRVGGRSLIINSYQADSPFNEADYWVLQEDIKLPKKGLMAVGLTDARHGVEVTSIAPYSKANEAGMKLGDRIVAIDSTTINDFIDVKMALMDAAPGGQVRALVLRQAGDQEVSLPLQLSLIDPPAETH
jgi:uncharacterized iron-regulated protein